MLNIYKRNRVLFFMTGDSKPEQGYVWDYGNADYKRVPSWKAGQWHHLAVTWNSATGRKQMFLDGKLISENTTEWLRRDPFRDAGRVFFNANGNAPGSYDEALFYNRVLSPHEITLLHDDPQGVARLLNEKLNEKLPQPKAEPQ